ncbi:MAG: LOG family protein [Chloroflexi bacterium]|nr:MAG: LOG family protein [Chloroflexota bacterium]MBL1196319.1 LOG family protein [Chloroflexota bacterium]NOH13614.1 LOG family protein [Chloroflexota bacterium]
MTAKRITVFGGSAPKAGEKAYKDALLLGKLLGEANHAVLTGGYMGTMEAVSRGANEAGGHVIGITCEEIEAWRDSKANPWVIEEIKHNTLKERLYALIEGCDGALALPGGVGTLAEITTMWNQMQTAALSKRPLVLIGAGWQAVFEQMFTHLESYVPAAHRELLVFAPDVVEATKDLKRLLEQQLPNS